MVILVLFGIGNNSQALAQAKNRVVSLLPALCMDLFGARAVSSIIGSLYSGAALGNLLGSTLAGAVFNHTGSYGAVIWACIALSTVATLASVRLIRPRQVSY